MNVCIISKKELDTTNELIETLLEDFVLIETLWNEFDSYDHDELLSDTNYDNSHFTNPDQPSEGE